LQNGTQSCRRTASDKNIVTTHKTNIVKDGTTGLVDVKANRLLLASLRFQLEFPVGQDRGRRPNLHGHRRSKGTDRMQISKVLLERVSDLGALLISKTSLRETFAEVDHNDDDDRIRR